MRIGDARAMPIDHEDMIAVTPTSLYYREKKNRTMFSLYRLDEEDGVITQLNRREYADYGYTQPFVDLQSRHRRSLAHKYNHHPLYRWWLYLDV